MGQASQGLLYLLKRTLKCIIFINQQVGQEFDLENPPTEIRMNLKEETSLQLVFYSRSMSLLVVFFYSLDIVFPASMLCISSAFDSFLNRSRLLPCGKPWPSVQSWIPATSLVGIWDKIGGSLLQVHSKLLSRSEFSARGSVFFARIQIVVQTRGENRALRGKERRRRKKGKS